MQEVSVIKRRRVGRSGQQLARFRIVWFVVLERRLLYDAHKPSSMVADPQYIPTYSGWLLMFPAPERKVQMMSKVRAVCLPCLI